MYHPFTIASSLNTAWGIFKRNFVTIIVYSVVTTFIVGILTIIFGVFFTSQNFYADMFVSLLIIVFQSYTTLGLYKLIFTLIDSEFYEFHISQIFPRFTMLVSYIVVWLIFAFLVVNYNYLIKALAPFGILQEVAEFMGVVVVLYLMLRSMFFLSFIADEDSGPLESLKQSFVLTKGNFVNVLLILGIVLLLIAVPAILSQYFILAPVFIIFSYPFVNIFLAVAYRKLIYSHKDVDDLDSETV